MLVSVLICVAMGLPLGAQDAGRMGLAEAERIAESNSFDLRISRAELAATDEALDGRFREFFPSVNVSYRRNRAVARRNIDNGTHSVQVSVSQPVYDGGRTGLAYEIAQIDVALARERINEQRNQIRYQVREAYLGLLQQRENMGITRLSLQTARDVRDRAAVQLRQGAITPLDYAELENEFRRRELELQQQEDAYGDSVEDFARLLRLPDDEQVEPEPLNLHNFEIGTIQVSDDELYRLAINNRSDVRQARIDLMRSRREYLITKYDYLPTISLTGNYGKTGDDWPPRNTEWGVGINFTFRIFGNTLSNDAQYNRSDNETSTGYSTSGQLSIYDNAAWREPHLRNQIQLLQSIDSNEQLKKDILAEVRRLRREFIARTEQLKLTDRALAIQEQRFRINQLRFRRGELAVSEYLEEELQLIQGRLNYVQERISLVLAANQLELNMGLPLDSLSLVQIRELTTEEAAEQPPLWQPHARIRVPDRAELNDLQFEVLED
ncbi:MAG: TolC family protein, partial [Leptospiraceae bacterium]|nr:TolC family protein [Leptospiraceae bacterium]